VTSGGIFDIRASWDICPRGLALIAPFPFVRSLNETMFLMLQVWVGDSGRVRPFGEHKPNTLCSTKLKILDDSVMNWGYETSNNWHWINSIQFIHVENKAWFFAISNEIFERPFQLTLKIWNHYRGSSQPPTFHLCQRKTGNNPAHPRLNSNVGNMSPPCNKELFESWCNMCQWLAKYFTWKIYPSCM
jgi:hypothetical protein